MQHDVTVYDKAKWHSDADNYPTELPVENAYIHTGMFLGWTIENNLFGGELSAYEDVKKDVQAFKDHKITGTQFFDKHLDGVLSSEDLNEEGNQFARDYFEGGRYLRDYGNTLCKDLPSEYHVEDTWENYQKIKEKIDERYISWKKRKNRNCFQKFWARLIGDDI